MSKLIYHAHKLRDPLSRTRKRKNMWNMDKNPPFVYSLHTFMCTSLCIWPSDTHTYYTNTVHKIIYVYVCRSSASHFNIREVKGSRKFVPVPNIMVNWLVLLLRYWVCSLAALEFSSVPPPYYGMDSYSFYSHDHTHLPACASAHARAHTSIHYLYVAINNELPLSHKVILC